MQPIKYRPGAVLASGHRSDRLVATATALGALALGTVAVRKVLSRISRTHSAVTRAPAAQDRTDDVMAVDDVVVETMRVTFEIVEQRISRSPLR